MAKARACALAVSRSSKSSGRLGHMPLPLSLSGLFLLLAKCSKESAIAANSRKADGTDFSLPTVLEYWNGNGDGKPSLPKILIPPYPPPPFPCRGNLRPLHGVAKAVIVRKKLGS